jgi:hypothetical protein
LSLVHSQLGSGLVVASEAMDEASVRRALKQHDPDLALTPDVDDETGRVVWTVMKRVGEGRMVVCRWRDETDPERRPLPLSHGLVEKVKRLDLNSRAPRVDVEAENLRLQEKGREEDIEQIEWYARELAKRLHGHSTSVLPRGRYRRSTAFRDVTDVR